VGLFDSKDKEIAMKDLLLAALFVAAILGSNFWEIRMRNNVMNIFFLWSIRESTNIPV
jgi:hypothetical protein